MGQTLEKELMGKEEKHRFQISLEKGRYIRLYFKQVSTLLVVSAFTPSGVLIEKKAPTNQSKGPLLLSFTATESGPHEIRVHALRFFDPDDRQKRPTQGKYQVKILESLSPSESRGRQEAIENDPRVQWCREHAVELNTLSSICAIRRVVGNG